MAAYNRMPDLISSSVNIDMKDVHGKQQKTVTSRTIYPFMSSHNHTPVGAFILEIAKLSQQQEAKKIALFIGFCVLSTCILLYWCHTTGSMALTAFTFLIIFDVLSLMTCMLSVWVQRQKPSNAYSFGYERFEVLAVFSSTMLAQLGAFFIAKESVEGLLFPQEIHSGRLLVGCCFGLVVHLLVLYAVRNRPFHHVMDASSSSWLQEHVSDVSESLCSLVPGLTKLLLPRMNPFALLGFGCFFSVIVTYFLIDTYQYFVADAWAAVLIAFMTFGTMFPMSSYTGRILLQTSPSHIIGQLDKVLREASTLDGVLEFRQEHFWTLSFVTLAGSVQVRVRRDADEQLVLAHVYNRLSNLVSYLTIQIFKDDWSRSTTYMPNPLSGLNFPSNMNSPGISTPPQMSSPTQELLMTPQNLQAASNFRLTSQS